MRWVATVVLLMGLADCSGAAQYSVDRPAPPGAKPELVCANTSACLTALPIPTATIRRNP